MKKNKQVIRQGDVILVYVGDDRPKGNPVGTGQIVLAVGETTGHAHVLEGAVAEFFINGERVIWVEAPSTLIHEEHNPVQVDLGTWLVGNQVEPDAESIRRVSD